MKIKCAILNDEFLTGKLLKDNVSNVPDLRFDGVLYYQLKTSELINMKKRDVLFLYIQTPKTTAFGLKE